MTAGLPLTAMSAHSCHVEVVRHPDQLGPEVRNFMDCAERRCVEFGFPWFRNLAATVYFDSTKLRFFVLWRAGEVISVLPLRAEKTAFGWDFYALGNFYTTLFEPLFAPDCRVADLAPLLAAVKAEFPALGALRLAPMDPAAPSYALLLAALRLSGWQPFPFFAFGNWYQRIDQSWSGYLADRAGMLRSTIKRAGKKFAAEGGTLEIVTAPDQLDRAIAAYQHVYGASWKKPEPFPAFMPGLLRTYAAQGQLRLGLAWLGAVPIAAQVWIVAHGKAEIYKLAYDEQYKAYASGTLLTAKLMEQAIDADRVVEIDYLIGDDPYKQAWMRDRRERWGVIAYHPGSLAGMAGWLQQATLRLLKQARGRLRRLRRA